MNAGIFWAIDTKLFIENFTIIGGWTNLGILAVLFTATSMILSPIIRIITFPLRIITLGLFTLALNGILLWILEAEK